MHYVVIEFVVSVNAVTILGKQLLQSVATPIWAAVFLGGNHIVVGHNYISVRTYGVKMYAEGFQQLVNPFFPLWTNKGHSFSYRPIIFFAILKSIKLWKIKKKNFHSGVTNNLVSLAAKPDWNL